MGKNRTSFKPGQSGNPKGRPKSSAMKELNEAIEEARKKHDLSILQQFVERAYKNDAVLIAVVRKLIADKTKAEVEGEFEVKGPLVVTLRPDEKRSKSRTS